VPNPQPPRPSLAVRRFRSAAEIQSAIDYLSPCFVELGALHDASTPDVALADAVISDVKARILEVFGPRSIEFAHTPSALSVNLHTVRDWRLQLRARVARQYESFGRVLRRLREKAAHFDAPAVGDATATHMRFTCFLGYSFSEPRAELYASLLQRFLQQIEVDVISGRDYEPRGVTEKVRARLDTADFGISILTEGSPVTWCRDELGHLRSRKRPIIPLLESGAEFVPGLFGDQEWIRFEKGHIGDAFLPLLEGLTFIERRQWQEVDESEGGNDGQGSSAGS
jgi:hypothetical protein